MKKRVVEDCRQTHDSTISVAIRHPEYEGLLCIRYGTQGYIIFGRIYGGAGPLAGFYIG